MYKKNIKQKDIKPNTVTKIPHTLRNLVWKTYASDTYLSANCFCCRKNIISIDNFMCGHIVSRYDGGTIDLDNLRPVCHSCNVSMGTCDMFKFIENNKLWLDNNNSNNKKNDNITGRERLRENTIKQYGYDIDSPEQCNNIRYNIANEYFKQIRLDIKIFIKSIIDEYIPTYYFEITHKTGNILKNVDYMHSGILDISNIKNTKYVHYYIEEGDIYTDDIFINPINPITNKNTKKYLIKYNITIIDSSVCSIKLWRLKI